MSRNRISFEYHNSFIAIFLIIFGSIFLSVGILIQFLDFTTGTADFARERISSMEIATSVPFLRIVFLLVFGGTGLIAFLVGLGSLLGYRKNKKTRNISLISANALQQAITKPNTVMFT